MYIYPHIDPVVAMYTDHPFLCWAAFAPHFSLSICSATYLLYMFLSKNHAKG
jgi:hypothetical protein